MKKDFTKIIQYLKKYRLQITFFFTCVLTFVLFNMGYVLTVKKYYLIFVNICFGFVCYIVYDFFCGKKIYYTKHIKNSNIRED